jgi:murein hydrolase activator
VIMRATVWPCDSRRGLLVAAALMLLTLQPAAAQEPSLDSLRQHELELEGARLQQRLSSETETKLKQEIDAIGEDRRKLNQSLIDTAARLRNAETRIAETTARLKPLDETERSIRESLSDRRALIIEVLAALQRIGRHPPPALMIRPEDALQSVRTAVMLGAVVPEMRLKAEALASDLADLVRIRREVREERERLQRDVAALIEERQRVTALSEERQRRQAATEKALDAERKQALGLARKVDNLKDLIGRIEQSIESAARAARTADPAPEEKSRGGRVDLTALSDPGRLTPALEFAAARGRLPLPVNGVRIREFGAPDKLGGTEKGITIATRAGAQVTSPCDGWVVYAGPFRNYGQVLILNGGGGYHVVLAGMERISVDVGQFVLTGEPVAVMGGGVAPASLAQGSSQPVLYVEFRKDGASIDPSPWWAASEGEKVRG